MVAAAKTLPHSKTDWSRFCDSRTLYEGMNARERTPPVPYLLNLVYLLLILVSLPWLLWQAVRKGKYREGYAAKFLGRVPPRTSSKKCLWLHAVSLGEVNLLAPLLKLIEQRQPDWQCVISTTTATGMAAAKKKYPQYVVFYCPLDFSWAVKAALRRVRPDLLVLAELELWPNLIRAARQSGARVAVINGRLGAKSFRGYRRIRPLVASLLRQIDLLAVQDETYAERFRALGARPETVRVTGSMKYDGAQTDRNNPATRRLAALAGFAADDAVLLAGSTQETEEEMALAAFRQLSPQWPRLRLVLVPRHPDRFQAVAHLLDSSGIPWQRRTRLEDFGTPGTGGGKDNSGAGVQGPGFRVQGAVVGGGKSELQNPKSEIPLPPPSALRPPPSALPSPLSPRVLLVDVVGELGAWWGTAHIAFVGGSMGSRGGQNMIEPAAYGAAVSFGPNTWNFRDVVSAMLERDAAVVVNDAEQFTRFVRRCLEQPDYAAALGRRAQAFVQSQLGATERTLALLSECC
jgi:3-deoxy-D-manno-octulosonic-acid transferase